MGAHYTTPREACIRHRGLGLSNLILRTTVMLWAIGYLLVYRKGYLRTSRLSFFCGAQLLSPIKDDLISVSRNRSTCTGDPFQYLDVHDIAYPDETLARTMFITTHVESRAYARKEEFPGECSLPTRKHCLWRDVGGRASTHVLTPAVKQAYTKEAGVTCVDLQR